MAQGNSMEFLMGSTKRSNKIVFVSGFEDPETGLMQIKFRAGNGAWEEWHSPIRTRKARDLLRGGYDHGLKSYLKTMYGHCVNIIYSK